MWRPFLLHPPEGILAGGIGAGAGPRLRDRQRDAVRSASLGLFKCPSLEGFILGLDVKREEKKRRKRSLGPQGGTFWDLGYSETLETFLCLFFVRTLSAPERLCLSSLESGSFAPEIRVGKGWDPLPLPFSGVEDPPLAWSSAISAASGALDERLGPSLLYRSPGLETPPWMRTFWTPLEASESEKAGPWSDLSGERERKKWEALREGPDLGIEDRSSGTSGLPGLPEEEKGSLGRPVVEFRPGSGTSPGPGTFGSAPRSLLPPGSGTLAKFSPGSGTFGPALRSLLVDLGGPTGRPDRKREFPSESLGEGSRVTRGPTSRTLEDEEVRRRVEALLAFLARLRAPASMDRLRELVPADEAGRTSVLPPPKATPRLGARWETGKVFLRQRAGVEATQSP